METQDKGGVLCEGTCSIADRSFPSTRRPWFSRTLTMHLLTISSCCDESSTASLVEASELIEPARSRVGQHVTIGNPTERSATTRLKDGPVVVCSRLSICPISISVVRIVFIS